ncbi:hypothetical protein [Colwellia sp. 20A7]|uniref:hypothetical protein n=1 Tax=Colwellia sp. 20A7 TaxID=2689569 RepID=UPI00135916ED|nr:hypothetical protein [Colwellia sp. 20A7]
MKGYPPVVLVDTWLFIATNQHTELIHSKSHALNAIDIYFGSIELAYLYIEQVKRGDVDSFLFDKIDYNPEFTYFM